MELPLQNQRGRAQPDLGGHQAFKIAKDLRKLTKHPVFCIAFPVHTSD